MDPNPQLREFRRKPRKCPGKCDPYRFCRNHQHKLIEEATIK